METLLIDTVDFKITETDFLIRTLVSLGIGFVIGLEREYSAMNENQKGFAGIRTFILVVMLGFMSGLLYYLLIPAISIGIFSAIILLTGISYFVTASKGNIGSTTEFSLIISFFLGTLAFLGWISISLMLMVIVVVLLSAKVRIQSFVGKITIQELYDFIRFVVIALLIFPFLPDENFGPYNNLNPHEIGWVVLLTSGLGFVGYILIKVFGPRKGILLSGIAGGLISSTVVTWVFAQKSLKSPAYSRHCAIAILAATFIMFIRILVWTFIFSPILFQKIYLTIFGILTVTISIILLFYLKKGHTSLTTEDEKLSTAPLNLKGALTFGLIYMLILFIVSYANDKLGESGLIISTAIAGFSDIDAITITVSKMAGKQLPYTIAGQAVLIATISNTLIKTGIGLFMGSRALKKYLLIGYGAIITTGIVAIILLS